MHILSQWFGQPSGRLFLIVLAAILVQLILFSHKSLFHNDELASFYVANGEKGMYYFEDKREANNTHLTGDYFQALITQRGNSSFALMWKNLPNDNHMPVYFVLLRGISCFFEPVFSIIPAVILNVLALIFLLYGFYYLLKRVFKNEEIAVAGTFWFAFSYTVLSLEAYIRMYLLWMAFIVWLVNFMIAFLEEERNDYRCLVLIWLFSLLQILTHFYGFIFEFALGVSGFLVLKYSSYQHKIKKMVLLSAAVLCSVLSACLIYPGMFEAVRFVGRGGEAVGLLYQWVEKPFDVFKQQFELFKEALYFDWKWLLGIMSVALLFCFLKKDNTQKRYRLLMSFLVLLIFLYMLFVMAVMPSVPLYSLRYFSSVISLIFILLVFICVSFGNMVGLKKSIAVFLLFIGGINAFLHATHQDSPFYFRNTLEDRKLDRIIPNSHIWWGVIHEDLGFSWEVSYGVSRLAKADDIWMLVDKYNESFISYAKAEKNMGKYAYLILPVSYEEEDEIKRIVSWARDYTGRNVYYLFTIKDGAVPLVKLKASVFMVAPF